MTTVAFYPDKPLDQLHVGDVVKVTITADGLPITGGAIQWGQRTPALLKCEPLTGSTVPGQVQKFTALAAGTSDIFCVLNGIFSPMEHVAVASATPLPVPTPIPTVPSDAPAATWIPLHAGQPLKSTTDFYYNTTSTIEHDAALRFDVFFSGDRARHQRMKAINPNSKWIKYVLQWTTQQPIAGWVYPPSGPRYWSLDAHASLATSYSADYDAWCKAHGIAAHDEEYGWLHKADGTRLTVQIWGQNRWMCDPRSVVMHNYQIDRFKRLTNDAILDGAFCDEFGSGQLTGRWLAAGLDATAMQAMKDAETALIKATAASIYPKQLVLNGGNYTSDWDFALAQAARGVHMEQMNNPMVLELWSVFWPFLDKLFAAGIFVNLVPLYSYQDYQHLHDGQAYPNYMDTNRGKLLELVSAYMVVPGNLSLLALHLENGPWGTGEMSSLPNMMSNYIKQWDTILGKPLEARQRPTGEHFYTRRFEHGLVVYNPIWNRLTQNYGAGGAKFIPLPTDRKYAQVKPDGTVGPVVTSVTLRCPEAAILVVVP